MQGIRFARKEPDKKSVLKTIENEEIKQWFFQTFEDFTPAQKYALYYISKANNVLITSPTGSGKTLSAFLFSIDHLLTLAKKNELEDRIYVLYISPLKALNNDIQRNLEIPLKEISQLTQYASRIRVGVRTSDTPADVKAKMLRKPPHVLITTPESIAIALNAPKFSEKLLGLKWIIVDEIHALAENKRGVHLSLSLERLVHRMKKEPVRIGLSATIHPLEEVAKFLVGFENPEEKKPRNCVIVDVNFAKKMDIRVISPVSDFIYTPSEELSRKLYKAVLEHIKSHRTTLVFTNTRSATERVVFHLKQEMGNGLSENLVDDIGAHHSSLSRDVRLEVEEGLKNGKYRAVVSSTSLELGIDIGYIDLVLLLGSPKSATRGVQRIGRSGHKLHEISKGRIIVLDRDDLVECAVLAKYARERKLERVKIPRNCLDVLAQHLVGMSLEKKWNVSDAYDMVRKAMPYNELAFEDFKSVLSYLSGNKYLETQRVYGKIWYDGNEFGRRGKMTRAIYYMNSGTIPDEVAIKVYTDGDHRFIGKLEEEFVERLSPGDIFVLGGKTYEFRKLRSMRAFVIPQPTKKPTVPAWFSEMLPLQYDLALHIAEFRDWMRKILKEKKEKAIEQIASYLKIDSGTANAIYTYFKEQEKYVHVPEKNELLIEEFMDEDGLYCYVFHSLIGRRANDAISRAVAHAVANKKRGSVRVSVNDNGFMLTLEEKLSREEIAAIFQEKLEELVMKAIGNTEMFKRRFRHVAVRSFLILRKYGEHTKSVHYQQYDAQILVKLLQQKFPDFPVIKETYREILEDSMDIENAVKYWNGVREKKIKIRFIRLPMPSPFAFNIVAASVSDIVLMADRKEYIMGLHRKLMELLASESNGIPA
ncbi:MAG: ATP-dependent helicase [Thermoplasmata archaeon]